MPGERNGQPGPIDRAREIAAPILALQAGDDQNITAGAQRGLRRGADARPASSTRSITYDGAPHSFFDRKFEEYADASDDAWRRVLAFIETAPRLTLATRRRGGER